MSGTQFSFTRSADGVETIVLISTEGRGVRVIPDTHVNFETIFENLVDQRDVDEAALFELADAATTVIDKLTRLSERVTIQGGTIFFDGDPMESRLTRHIVDMIKAGDQNYLGYVLFLENVQANPSKRSRKGLFKFLDVHDLMITPDGRFIGYKGIGSDGRSITAGKEDVTVTLADGTVETHQGHIPNPVGATVEMARSQVDPDRDQTCSVGLHVADFEYAQNWGSGGRFLTVAVNPRDVVEVPNEPGAQKIRVARYEVLEDNDSRTEYTGTSWTGPGVDGVDYDEEDLDEE